MRHVQQEPAPALREEPLDESGLVELRDVEPQICRDRFEDERAIERGLERPCVTHVVRKQVVRVNRGEDVVHEGVARRRVDPLQMLRRPRRIVQGDEAACSVEGGIRYGLAQLTQEIVEEKREARSDGKEEWIVGTGRISQGKVLDEPREVQRLPCQVRMVEGADGHRHPRT